MALDREDNIDGLAAWAHETERAMSGAAGELRPIQEVYPVIAAHLRQLARETFQDAAGEELNADTTVQLLCRPGRIRVSIGESSYETGARGDPSSLEAAVVSAAHALAVSRTEY